VAEHQLLHATCVAMGDKGVLLLGPPSAGKSDLALRLIDMPGRGAGEASMDFKLVSDDQVMIRRESNDLYATPPQPIAGHLEIRGLGIVHTAHRARIKLVLAVKLMAAARIERMPDRHKDRFEMLGVTIPLIAIDPNMASAPARLRAALSEL
jgi:serine kinase of HPr protein (carbohydrate metabolism regulator)